MTLKDFIIYTAGIAGGCMLIYGAGCSLNDWLKDRREDMKMARAIRLGRMAHEEHSYTIAPVSLEEQEEIHDFCLAAEQATANEWIKDEDEYASWVESGLHWATIHANPDSEPFGEGQIA